MTPNAQTLTQRFAAGRLPLNDALRFASQIVDSLRHAHEEGCCHGALTPDAVLLTATGVELVPAEAGVAGQVTGYTAPELLTGHAPDARTDIFSLGALLFEMFTGRRAFPGDTPEELRESIEKSNPEPIGDTALDRLILNCLVKDPAGRWQRVQQVHMEFKILVFSARRIQQPAGPRPAELALQTELRQVETRLNARIEQQYGDTVAGLRHLSAQLPLLESQLAARLDQESAETTAALRHVAAELPLMESHLASRLEERHGEMAAGLQHLAAELPLIESRLSSRLERHEGALAGIPELESRLASQLERHEAALGGIPELRSRIEFHDGVLSGLPELESRLALRIDQHDGALAGLPELESRLTSRIDRHDGALAGIPELESRLVLRIDQHDGALAGLPE